MNTEKNFALLIDADNVSYNYLPIMLEEAKRYGNVAIRRIYGDWTDCRKNTWKDILLENSIIPIQQYSYTIGKNASDSAMIIDAMDILYSDQVSGFIIVSSDSDFTRLAMRLREAGMTVIGMGESKTPTAFVKACEEFKLLDVLYKNTASDSTSKDTDKSHLPKSGKEYEKVEAKPMTSLSEIKKSMCDILENNSDEDGKMRLSEMGRLLTKTYPDFDPRNYGRERKLSEFIKKMPEFKVDKVYFEGNTRPPLAYIMHQSKND